MPELSGFRARVRSRERLVGTFIKTRTHQAVEIMSLAGMDFVILDAEHGPIDVAFIDLAVAVSRAPVLVRVPESATELASAACDLGAHGIVFPHVRSAAEAQRAVGLVRFASGVRGLSTSVRAAGYGALSPAEYAACTDASVAVFAQIEDAEALSELETIAQVEGVDALFVGRFDLAAAMGKLNVDDPIVATETARILRVARRHGLGGAIFANYADDASTFLRGDATIAIVASDLTFMASGARNASSQLKSN